MIGDPVWWRPSTYYWPSQPYCPHCAPRCPCCGRYLWPTTTTITWGLSVGGVQPTTQATTNTQAGCDCAGATNGR